MKVLASETENLDSIDRGIRRTQPSSPSFVTTEDETKKRSIPPAALEANDKMIWFLTGKPASARSKYAKAFKFPTKVCKLPGCFMIRHESFIHDCNLQSSSIL